MLFRLDNLLNVTLSNPMPHPLLSPPIQLYVNLSSKIWLLSNIQQAIVETGEQANILIPSYSLSTFRGISWFAWVRG